MTCKARLSILHVDNKYSTLGQDSV